MLKENKNGIIVVKFVFYVYNDIGKMFVYIGYLLCICY